MKKYTFRPLRFVWSMVICTIAFLQLGWLAVLFVALAQLDVELH